MTGPAAPEEPDRALELAIEAERQVLGSALLSAEAAVIASRALAASDFYLESHRKTFAALAALIDRGTAPTPLLIAQELGADLELAGGYSALAALTDLRCTAASLPAVCRMVSDHARRRRATQLAQAIADDPASANGKFDELRAALEPPPESGWASVARNARDFQSATFPELVSVLGHGLLARGDLGVFYGDAGLGKSWLTAMLALAVARGEPWLGIAGPEQPMRVAMVSFETHAARLRERLAAIGGEQPESLWLLAPPDIPPLANLLEPRDRALVSGLCRELALDLLILDPLSRTHQEDENDTQAGARIMAAAHALRSESGAAVLLVHHERKTPAQAQSKDESDLGALRGSSRFQSDPTLLLRLKRHGNLRQLRCAKANNGQPFEPIWIAPSKGDGPATVVPNPHETADETHAAIRAAMEKAGGWVSVTDLAASVGKTPRTVQRHLSSMGDVETAGNTNNRQVKLATLGESVASVSQVGISDWAANE